MSDISRAIAAKQANIKILQTDLEALRRAARILGSAGAGTKPKRRRRKMSAATRKALSKKLKAYWAKKHAKK